MTWRVISARPSSEKEQGQGPISRAVITVPAGLAGLHVIPHIVFRYSPRFVRHNVSVLATTCCAVLAASSTTCVPVLATSFTAWFTGDRHIISTT